MKRTALGLAALLIGSLAADARADDVVAPDGHHPQRPVAFHAAPGKDSLFGRYRLFKASYANLGMAYPGYGPYYLPGQTGPSIAPQCGIPGAPAVDYHARGPRDYFMGH
jgi:hypothetical protein